MKKKKEKMVEQPVPFTPGITRAMVRQHAFELYRDKLPNHPLTVEDWVLAGKRSREFTRGRQFTEINRKASEFNCAGADKKPVKRQSLYRRSFCLYRRRESVQ